VTSFFKKTSLAESENSSWSDSIKSCLDPCVVRMLFLGFSSGLPLLLIFSSLSIWLREAGIERASVTYFSWAALAFSFKFVWAPLIDRLPLPCITNLLGRRRSWLLVSQIIIVLSVFFIAVQDPTLGVFYTAIGAISLSISAATQDIVVDAYRIETADNKLQALMASSYVAGYRIGMIFAGAGTLKMAVWYATGNGYDFNSWSSSYITIAIIMMVGPITTLLIPEPALSKSDDYVETSSVKYDLRDYFGLFMLFIICVVGFVAVFVGFSSVLPLLKVMINLGVVGSFLLEVVRVVLGLMVSFLLVRIFMALRITRQSLISETYIEPFVDFFNRYGRVGIIILVFIGTYRISDIVMGAVANIFYIDVGFTKDQIANIAKTFGLIMVILGGILGGVLTVRYGVLKILWWGAVLTVITNLLFVILALVEPQSYILILVIAADNISGGFAGTAFVAYLSGLTNRSFTAIQYAVFSSLMTLFPKIIAGYSGSIVDAFDYESFFFGSALLGIPIIFMVSWLIRLEKSK